MLLCMGGLSLASAQTGTPITALQPSPAAQLKALEPSAEEPYTLGGGDELSLECAGRAELSGKHVVGPDGRITLPVAGTSTLR